MNISIAKERRGDILKVDSINSTNADFMVTHVPFRAICVKQNLLSNQSAHYTEEEIFSRFFADPDVYDKHQFIIVEGSSGSGKSHFIRWLNAKMQVFVDNGTDVVLLIRRSDNTLKGTIKQLLNNETISGIKNKDAYERLVQANQTISEAKFKEKIYSEFIVEINTSEQDDTLNKVQKKQLVALLNNDKFKDRMMTFAGPIDRIYQKVVGTESGIVHSEDALFKESDFTLDIEFNQELKETADRKAIMMADRLIPDDNNESLANRITSFMNSFVDRVIRSCAGIEAGDFQAIFKEIRQELYLQKKNLILLIEDITAFTGINQDLLNALVTEHTGLNEADKLCRLTAVVGTTTQYYSEFRDNYRDRITSQITIEDGTIGTNIRDVVLFCAKYLNALSLTEETIQTWYADGAKEEDFPLHNADFKWESIESNGKKLNLYPFTSRAINMLYQNMSVQKTPRYIIREIIEPAVNDVIANKGIFPLFLSKWRRSLQENIEFKISDALSRLEGINDKDNYKNCVLSLIYYWGDDTFDIKPEKGTISGIHDSIFVRFGLEKFSHSFLSGEIPADAPSDPEPETLPAPPDPTVPEVINKKYEELRKSVNDWFYEGKIFNKVREIRDALCAFVFDTLNWQQLGVSIAVRDLVKNSSVNLFSIERQDRANARGLIELKATEDTRDVLLAIGKYLYIGDKKWNFKDASAAIYTVTCWLEEHKEKIVKAVLEEECSVPTYIQCALFSDIIYLCLSDKGIKKPSDITADKFLQRFTSGQVNYSNHSREWGDLATICYNDNAARDNHNLVLNYFNLVQGSGVTKSFINHTALEQALKALEKRKYQFDFSSINLGSITDKKSAIQYCEKLYKRLEGVTKSENTFANGKIQELLNLFGYEEDSTIEGSDIRDLLTDIIEFYKRVDIYGLTIVQNRTNKAIELKSKSDEIAKTLSFIRKQSVQDNCLGMILKYSGEPMKIIIELSEFLLAVNRDSDTVLVRMENDKNNLVRSGGWVDEVDPRFERTTKLFEQFEELMEED